MTGRVTITPATYRAMQAAQMREDALQAQVEQIARSLGWLVYHTHDSRRSAAGFPDVVAVHPRRGRIVWAELKSGKGRVSDAQHEWLDALTEAGAEVYVWRPADLLSGAILDVFARLAPTRG